ncbi:MAG: bifunctional phosphoribosylaminoimidazolecarboxamide formyltransferase/IMP cyclohydrolase, partial [Proteobacteria bacterium]|nr:bifunctional phosphoribosylaminoimidazolecarboxamide formyltransferase/IMP cyclohydrolase [Pseudomonadota bacterium]
MPSAISRALISVSDKTGLVALGQALARHGVELISTGGSARALADAGVAVREVADYTGFPEILGGRVKTLHPRLYGGILAVRGDPGHRADIAANGIDNIDLVVVNLYPFELAVASGAADADCIEQIDIGGPSMIRAAAKNHESVTVIVDPADYGAVVAAMDAGGGAVPDDLRRSLAARAFARIAAYDAAISNWFAAREAADAMPAHFAITGERSLALRYGENPHQHAALYVTADSRPGVASATQIQGKELSYNNLADADAAFELAAEFDEPAVAIIKHANPSGAAVADSLAQAHARALACDPVSAFGGIVAVNRVLDRATAEAIVQVFTEVVIAPDADADARAVLAAKKNLRVLLAGGLPDPAAPGRMFRSLAGGLLVQGRDAGRVADADLKVVSKRPPTDDEHRDLLFAWRVCKHVKSNAIVFARHGATTGIGAGQMSRLDSVRIATLKAQAAAAAAGAAV